VVPGADVTIDADAAQLEQLLINILHNATEASLETKGTVTVGWRDMAECVEVFVRDTGPGIMNPTNLFVPFFTTKPGGSGIGLALSRQIAEAHGGSLTLANRAGQGATVCGNVCLNFEAWRFFGAWNFGLGISAQPSSHNRDSEIPLLKLFAAEWFLVLSRKPLVCYGLGICQNPWHGHCNRGES